jgi:hypothetical protein
VRRGAQLGQGGLLVVGPGDPAATMQVIQDRAGRRLRAAKERCQLGADPQDPDRQGSSSSGLPPRVSRLYGYRPPAAPRSPPGPGSWSSMMWPTRADQDAGLDQHDRVRAHQVLQSCLAPMAATLTEHLREVMRGVDALDLFGSIGGCAAGWSWPAPDSPWPSCCQRRNRSRGGPMSGGCGCSWTGPRPPTRPWSWWSSRPVTTHSWRRPKWSRPWSTTGSAQSRRHRRCRRSRLRAGRRARSGRRAGRW